MSHNSVEKKKEIQLKEEMFQLQLFKMHYKKKFITAFIMPKEWHNFEGKKDSIERRNF